MSASNGTLNGTTDRGWSEAKECPICQHNGWCQVSDDGELAQCMREPKGAFKTATDKNGADYYLHRLKDSLDFGRPPSKPKPRKPASQTERADPDTLDQVYQAMLGRLDLSKIHREALNRRGLDDGAVEALGYRSLRSLDHRKHAEALAEQFGAETLARVPGFFRDQHGPALVGMDGLLVPVRDTKGRIIALKVRLDKPMKSGGKYAYLSSKKKGGPSPGSPVHFPAGITSPTPAVRLTEGELKADVATHLSGMPTVSVAGVGNWRLGVEAAKALGAETVRVAFDADAVTKKEVALALLACCKALVNTGISVEVEHWPVADGKGIDDILVAGKTPAVLRGRDAVAEVEKLAEAHGVETADTDGLSVLERGRAVLAEGGADALYGEGNKPLLNDLAHADPAELARFKAELKAAGLSVRDFDRVMKGLNGNGNGDSGSNGRHHAPAVDGPSRFKLTDLGNGERLAELHGRNIRHCHPWNKWLVWDGARWSLDNTAKIRRLAKRTARAMLTEAAKIKDESEAHFKQLMEWQRESEKKERLSAMIYTASAEEGIPILPDDMDKDPWLFNCQNGTIDLRTGELREHRREDCITKLCPVRFDPAAECPLWLDTLGLFFAGNAGLISYFQRICGYAMTGVVQDHIMPVCYGTGANGKSTMLGTLLEVFGTDYAMKAPPDLLMAKKHQAHPTEQADLFGKRLVVAIESEGGRRLNETLVKELTGGDRIRARRMREDHWEFRPSHTLIMATNHKPGVRGTDNGIWRRLRLVPFSVQVEGEKADLAMPAKLRAEFPGILAWCVRGCLEWQRQGLDAPEVVTEATSEYREEQDVLGMFIAEKCIQIKSARVKASVLYACYRDWAEAAGEYSQSQKAFGTAIQERGITKERSNGYWYVGLGLASDHDTENDDPFTVTATAGRGSVSRERGEL